VTDKENGANGTKRLRRGHGRPTLHDVAVMAAVTRITVSRYINNPDKVATETGARIRAAIERTGYVPNRQAGQLASGASRIVAALIPNVGHSIFAETIQGLSEGLQGSGRELLLLVTGYSMEREEAQLRALGGWAPAALLVTGHHHTPAATRLLRQAQAGGAAIIEIWDKPAQEPAQDGAHNGFARIGFDHWHTGRGMAQHLLAQGHQSLAYVDSGVAEDFRAHVRGQGFAAACKAAGAKVRVWRADTGDVFEAGRKALRQLRALRGRQAVSAVAFANDHLACGALMQASQTGVAVLRQLAILGFGDFPIARQLTPALSTVRPPCAQIGLLAARSLLDAQGSGQCPASHTLHCELIARASSVVSTVSTN